jgi:hypothetical protein
VVVARALGSVVDFMRRDGVAALIGDDFPPPAGD